MPICLKRVEILARLRSVSKIPRWWSTSLTRAFSLLLLSSLFLSKFNNRSETRTSPRRLSLSTNGPCPQPIPHQPRSFRGHTPFHLARGRAPTRGFWRGNTQRMSSPQQNSAPMAPMFRPSFPKPKPQSRFPNFKKLRAPFDYKSPNSAAGSRLLTPRSVTTSNTGNTSFATSTGYFNSSTFAPAAPSNSKGKGRAQASECNGSCPFCCAPHVYGGCYRD
ncbi:hypothetical protein C8F01DRAFT_1106121 [Mycena amicta]|nr:hypothetical protein C8F01DRAFT_1106121 [Mycena amicta]